MKLLNCYFESLLVNVTISIDVLEAFFKLQTMGGDFSARGQQDCAKGIYCLAGKYLIMTLPAPRGSCIYKTPYSDNKMK